MSASVFATYRHLQAHIKSAFSREHKRNTINIHVCDIRRTNTHIHKLTTGVPVSMPARCSPGEEKTRNAIRFPWRPRQAAALRHRQPARKRDGFFNHFESYTIWEFIATLEHVYLYLRRFRVRRVRPNRTYITYTRNPRTLHHRILRVFESVIWPR